MKEKRSDWVKDLPLEVFEDEGPRHSQVRTQFDQAFQALLDGVSSVAADILDSSKFDSV